MLSVPQKQTVKTVLMDFIFQGRHVIHVLILALFVMEQIRAKNVLKDIISTEVFVLYAMRHVDNVHQQLIALLVLLDTILKLKFAQNV